MRKLRTLRHPGVIRVYDTVEVFLDLYISYRCSGGLIVDADRNIHLHCNRAGHPLRLACAKKESDRRDFKMGSLYDCSRWSPASSLPAAFAAVDEFS